MHSFSLFILKLMTQIVFQLKEHLSIHLDTSMFFILNSRVKIESSKEVFMSSHLDELDLFILIR